MNEEQKYLLTRYCKISDYAVSLLSDSFCYRDYKKNSIIIEADKVCDSIFYMDRGLIRTYFWDAKGNEVTQCFGVKGDLFASMFSYYNHEPVFMQVEAVTDVSLFVIEKDVIEKLCSENIEIANWMRIACIEQLYCLERRCKIFGNEEAINRYKSLIKVRPQIVKEVPLKHIASYLGITQQSLSRLRAKLGTKE